MSEDNVLSSFNFLDEEDDDSDEEGDRWEDETSSASQLTKVVHVQSHTHTLIHQGTGRTRAHTHSPRYGEDTCTHSFTKVRGGHVHTLIHQGTGRTRAHTHSPRYGEDTCTHSFTKVRGGHVHTLIHQGTGRTRAHMHSHAHVAILVASICVHSSVKCVPPLPLVESCTCCGVTVA